MFYLIIIIGSMLLTVVGNLIFTPNSVANYDLNYAISVTVATVAIIAIDGLVVRPQIAHQAEMATIQLRRLGDAPHQRRGDADGQMVNRAGLTLDGECAVEEHVAVLVGGRGQIAVQATNDLGVVAVGVNHLCSSLF